MVLWFSVVGRRDKREYFGSNCPNEGALGGGALPTQSFFSTRL